MSNEKKIRWADRIAHLVVGTITVLIWYGVFRLIMGVDHELSFVGAAIIAVIEMNSMRIDEKIEALTQEMMR
jgi:small-conductance mechanosensitive channel